MSGSEVDSVLAEVEADTPLARLLNQLTELTIQEQEQYTTLEVRYEETSRQREAAFREAKEQLEKDHLEEIQHDVQALRTARNLVYLETQNARRSLIYQIQALPDPPTPVVLDSSISSGDVTNPSPRISPRVRRSSPPQVPQPNLRPNQRIPGVPARPVNAPRELPVGTRVQVINKVTLAKCAPAKNLEGRIIRVGTLYYTIQIWNPVTSSFEDHRRIRKYLRVLVA